MQIGMNIKNYKLYRLSFRQLECKKSILLDWEKLSHKLVFFYLVELLGACSCCSRGLSAMEFYWLVENFFKSWGNVIPSAIILVLFLNPFNTHIRVIF